MRTIALLLMTLGWAGAALADDLPLPDTHGLPTKLLADVAGDFNGDGVPDRARLVLVENKLDLAIYLSAEGKLPVKPALEVWDLAEIAAPDEFEWAEIALSGPDKLTLENKNDTFGREHWHERFTMAGHDGAFAIVAYHFDFQDTIDKGNFGACDLDLLTGKGQRNDRPFTVPPAVVKLADWNRGVAHTRALRPQQWFLPEQCRF